MIYRLLVRRRALAGWRQLSAHDLASLPLDEQVRFSFPGNHALAAEATSAREVRAWLEDLFARFPDLRFEVEELVVEGPPWSTRVATRYVAVRGGRTIYRGASFVRLAWGRLVEERVYPDTQAIAEIVPATPGSQVADA
jgi:ketosteroid isomerase-like protein